MIRPRTGIRVDREGRDPRVRRTSMSYYPPAPVYGGGWGDQPPPDPLISREIGGWFGKAFGAVRRSWRRLVGIALLAVLPQLVLLVAAGVAVNGGQTILAVVLVAAGVVVTALMSLLGDAAGVWL